MILVQLYHELIMSPNIKLTLPLEIVTHISQILHIKECFLELESLLYIFPQLQDLFSHRIPTIVLVDTSQYDKYCKFIHTRERPFGSKDLLIIKQERDVESGRLAELESRCYMVLRSEFSQSVVPQTFEQLKQYVTLHENKTIIELHYNGFGQCYELLCDPKEDDEEVFSSYLRSPLNEHHSFHVALLLKAFVGSIDSKMLRFENYSSVDDLSFDYKHTFAVYGSMFKLKLPSDSVENPSFREDGILKTPKCSFEFIKDLNRFELLYQHSLCNGEKSNFIRHENPSCLTTLGKKLWCLFFGSKVVNVGLFLNVKDVTIDKVAQNEKCFVAIDCSISATKSIHSYDFIKNAYDLESSRVSRPQNKAPKLDIDEDIYTDELLGIILKLRVLQYYVNIRYKDFLAEVLQSTDITAFNPTITPTRSLSDYTNNQTNMSIKSSNELNLNDLECQINRLLRSLNELCEESEDSCEESEESDENEDSYKESEDSDSCEENDDFYEDNEDVYDGLKFALSQRIMRIITNKISNGISCEELNKEQPLRLRVFNKETYLIDRADRIHWISEWFRTRMS